MKSPIYLAGSWADRPRLRGIRDELAGMGVACTAQWLDYDDEPTSSKPIRIGSHLAKWAAIDLADLTAAQTVIVVTHIESTAGAMWFEFGHAHALGKTIIGIGPKTMLFCHLIADSNWYPAWPELRAALTDGVFV